MSSGMPDYHKTVRQRYGEAEIAKEWKTVTPNAYTDMMTITGKGVMYGGYLYMDTVSTQKNSFPALYVDDSIFVAETFDVIRKYGLKEARNSIITLNVFDEVNYIYSVGFSFGVTFDSELKLVYYEAHGGTPTVWGSLFYALM